MLYLFHPLLKAATRISFLCSLAPKSASPCLLPAISSFSRVVRNTSPRIIPAHSSSFIDMSGSAASAPEALPVIHLTPTESALFRQLEEFATFKSSSGSVPCIMRVCGGWVRDKLLQKDNDDIDICLDTCSGQEFTTELKAWFDSKDQSSLCSTVGIIKASTEKSKHLETAVIRITVTGEDVPEDTVVSLDFVQLRSEVYAENSRHPIVKCATPEEDATRRDFTINSMFYNIQNKTVEDFTGHGINDLRRGIIRTPIDAVRTLQDDPLRALRAIRFQGRFNFVLDQGLIDGLRDPEVKRKLTSIISRERIGEEISGMFRGLSPLTSLFTIHSCGLWAEVFGSIEVLGRGVPGDWESRSIRLLRCLPIDCRDRSLIVAVLTLPLGETDQALSDASRSETSSFSFKKFKGSTSVSACLLSALKWPTKDLDITVALHQGVFAIQKLFGGDRCVSDLSRSEIAFALRVVPTHLGDFVHLVPLVGRIRASVIDASLVEKWDQLSRRIQDENLGNICREPCLVDGREVQSALGVQGIKISQSIQLILQWQFNHPGCSKEDVLAVLTSQKDTFAPK